MQQEQLIVIWIIIKKTRNENKTKAQRQNFKWLIIFGVVCFVFGEMKKSNENTNKNITYNEHSYGKCDLIKINL